MNIIKSKKIEYINAYINNARINGIYIGDTNTLLLISPNIQLKGNKFEFIKNKRKTFSIFGILIKYINDNIIECSIKINYNDALKK